MHTHALSLTRTHVRDACTRHRSRRGSVWAWAACMGSWCGWLRSGLGRSGGAVRDWLAGTLGRRPPLLSIGIICKIQGERVCVGRQMGMVENGLFKTNAVSGECSGRDRVRGSPFRQWQERNKTESHGAGAARICAQRIRSAFFGEKESAQGRVSERASECGAFSIVITTSRRRLQL